MELKDLFFRLRLIGHLTHKVLCGKILFVAYTLDSDPHTITTGTFASSSTRGGNKEIAEVARKLADSYENWIV